MSDLRTDLVRAAGDVSDTGDLVNSATVLGRQRLRRRRRVARTAVTAGLTVIVTGAVWTGTHRSADELRVVPAISTSISPQREAATRALTEAVEDAFPQWSSTDRVLAGLNLGQNSDQNSVQNGWFTVTRGDTDPVEIRLTVQRAESSSFPDCSYCTVTTRDDGSELGTGRRTTFVSSDGGRSVVEEPWAQLLTADGLLISAEASPVDTPEEPLPEDVVFPEGSPVNEETLAALVQTPALQQVDLAG